MRDTNRSCRKCDLSDYVVADKHERHLKILGIKWQDHVRKAEVANLTDLPQSRNIRR